MIPGNSIPTQHPFHYTDEQGLRGILESGFLRPSLRASNPKDARYGDGCYLSDIRPGTISPKRLSRRLVGVPWMSQRFTHYVELDVTGLNLALCRENVFLVPRREPLPLEGRIKHWGTNEWSGT
ncbi:HYD1 signature containing ADP-ribosyltransferase family protein [Actinomadura geliboluensis]